MNSPSFFVVTEVDFLVNQDVVEHETGNKRTMTMNTDTFVKTQHVLWTRVVLNQCCMVVTSLLESDLPFAIPKQRASFFRQKVYSLRKTKWLELCLILWKASLRDVAFFQFLVMTSRQDWWSCRLPLLSSCLLKPFSQYTRLRRNLVSSSSCEIETTVANFCSWTSKRTDLAKGGKYTVHVPCQSCSSRHVFLPIKKTKKMISPIK